VSFFEPPEPPPDSPEPAFERKPWWTVPTNELGVSTGLRLVLARTEDAVVALLDAVAFTEGVAFTLSVLRRRPFEIDPFHHRSTSSCRVGRPVRSSRPSSLRFGVQFADGRKATTTGGRAVPAEGDPPRGPLLFPSDGGGGGDRWDQSFWLWPLPPPGPVSFVVEWPSEGIEVTRHEVDAEPILEASKSSTRLWPESPKGGGGTSTTQISFSG
jgi:hypothetical protein